MADMEQPGQKPENTREEASVKRQKFKESASAVKNLSDKAGGATTEPAVQGGDLVAERLQMVLERLYGPQYRAAQRFLKNRTLNKMNSKQTGMTLYERIMAYRKLKEESPSEEGLSSGGGSLEATDTPPVKRKLHGSFERSDTSFASVDISDLTNSEEEKNRTPTPPPTFEKPAASAKVLLASRANRVTSSADLQTTQATRAAPPEVKTHGKNSIQPPAMSAFKAWADDTPPPRPARDDRRLSEKDRVVSAIDRRLPAVDEQGQRSPVIKQLHPAYWEIPYIVATNGRYSTFAYLFRSKSVPDIVLGTEKNLSDNLHQMPGPPSSNSTGPKSRREHRKNRQSIENTNDLNLAQKVLLARRVETYIAEQEIQRGLRETYEEKTTARDVYVEIEDKDDQIVQREIKQQSTEKAVVVKKTVEEVNSSVQEAEEKKSNSRTERREDKRSDSRTERREDKRSDSHTEEKVVNTREERRQDRTELAAVHRDSRREEIRSESRDDKHQSVSRSDSHRERREDKSSDSGSLRAEERRDNVSKSAETTVVISETVSSSKKSATEQKSKTSDTKKSEERISSRSSSKGEKSVLEKTAEHVESSAEPVTAGSHDRPKAEDPRKETSKPVPAAKPRSDAAGTAAGKASTSQEKRPEARAASRQAEKKEAEQTIAALDKLADRTLNKLLGSDGGNDDEDDEDVRKVLEKAFSPEFQAELDNFLRTT